MKLWSKRIHGVEEETPTSRVNSERV